MNSGNPVCIYCKEYREYCQCERAQLQPSLEDVYQVEKRLIAVEKKIDRVLEILEGGICSVDKIEL